MKCSIIRLCALSLAALLVCTSCAGQDTAPTSESHAASSSQVSSVQSEAASSEVSSSETVSVYTLPKNDDYSKMVFNFTDIENYVKITGRYTAVTNTKNSALTFDNSANSLTVKCNCTGNVDIAVDFTLGPVKDKAYLVNYFVVFIDGKQQKKKLSLKGIENATVSRTLRVASKLKKGKHTITLWRCNEMVYGRVDLKTITMNGVPTAREKDKAKHIEFIGDAVAAGLGVLSESTLPEEKFPCSTKYSDATLAFPYLTAGKLKADFSSVCVSSLTFSERLASRTASSIYDEVCTWRGNEKYDFSRKNDYVVIELGSNDSETYMEEEIPDREMSASALIFLQHVRQKNPDSKIIWLYGHIENHLDNAITEAIKLAGGEEKGYYYCKMDRVDCSGGLFHPSRQGQQAIADKLAEFIANIEKPKKKKTTSGASK